MGAVQGTLGKINEIALRSHIKAHVATAALPGDLGAKRPRIGQPTYDAIKLRLAAAGGAQSHALSEVVQEL